jgi:hypothetical protein
VARLRAWVDGWAFEDAAEVRDTLSILSEAEERGARLRGVAEWHDDVGVAELADGPVAPLQGGRIVRPVQQFDVVGVWARPSQDRTGYGAAGGAGSGAGCGLGGRGPVRGPSLAPQRGQNEGRAAGSSGGVRSAQQEGQAMVGMRAPITLGELRAECTAPAPVRPPLSGPAVLVVEAELHVVRHDRIDAAPGPPASPSCGWCGPWPGSRVTGHGPPRAVAL